MPTSRVQSSMSATSFTRPMMRYLQSETQSDWFAIPPQPHRSLRHFWSWNHKNCQKQTRILFRSQRQANQANWAESGSKRFDISIRCYNNTLTKGIFKGLLITPKNKLYAWAYQKVAYYQNFLKNIIIRLTWAVLQLFSDERLIYHLSTLMNQFPALWRS